MKIKSKWLQLFLLGTVLTSVTGCSGQQAINETKVYSLDIDGERQYYDETSKEVVAIKATAEGFLNVGVYKDYENPDSRTEQEYYIKAVKEANIANNVPEMNEKSMIDNQLKISVDQIDMHEIKLISVGGKESCIASYTYISTVQNAIPQYLENLQIEGNVPYSRTIQFEMEKEDDGWKIVRFKLGKRERV